MLLAGSKPTCVAAPFHNTSLDKQVTMKEPCVILQLINPLVKKLSAESAKPILSTVLQLRLITVRLERF